jgi:hippurate hydrolase
MMQERSDLVDEARRIGPELRALRRRLHAHPETGLELPITQATLRAELEPLGLELSYGEGLTSIVAVLRGGAPGPTLLLRSDMDGLPVAEATELEYHSTNGAMHACGHDLHMSALIGAARLLAARREELVGDVVFMFQPGEEGHQGALLMLDEGVLEAAGAKPSRAYALHVFSDMPYGLFTSRAGALMAAIDKLDITVNGAGGHGGTPHRTIDPIPIAAEIVLAMQSYVARKLDTFDPAVVTIGEFHSGTARNIVPGDAFLSAGVRTFDVKMQEKLRTELPVLADGIASAHGASATTLYEIGEPLTANAPQAVADAERVISGLLGPERFSEISRPVMMAEDFSFVLEAVPGAMIFLGAAPPDADLGLAPSNHSAQALFDDGVVPDAAAVLAALALEYLAESRDEG